MGCVLGGHRPGCIAASTWESLGQQGLMMNVAAPRLTLGVCLRVHVPPSLAATCQLSSISLKAGRKIYIGSAPV
jgi:hypothetical protein